MTAQYSRVAIAAAAPTTLLVVHAGAATLDGNYAIPSPRQLSAMPEQDREAFANLTTGGITFSNHYTTQSTPQPATDTAGTTKTLLGPDGHVEGTLTLNIFDDEVAARAVEGFTLALVGVDKRASHPFALPQSDPSMSVNCVATTDATGQSERITCLGRQGPNLVDASLAGQSTPKVAGPTASTPAEDAAGLIAEQAIIWMAGVSLQGAATTERNPSTPEALLAAGLTSAPADRDTAFQATELSGLDPATRANYEKFESIGLKFGSGYLTSTSPISASSRFAQFSQALTGPKIDSASSVTYEIFANAGAASAFILGAAVGLDRAWTPTAEGTLETYTIKRDAGGATHCFALAVTASKLDLARCFASDGVYAAVGTVVVPQTPPFGAQHIVPDFPVNLAAIVASLASETLAKEMTTH